MTVDEIETAFNQGCDPQISAVSWYRCVGILLDEVERLRAVLTRIADGEHPDESPEIAEAALSAGTGRVKP